MTKYTRSKSASVLVLGMIILIIATYFVTKQVKGYQTLNRNLQQMKQEITQHAALQPKLAAEKEKLVACQAEFHQYESLFNREITWGKLMAVLGNEAEKHRVTITAITPLEVTKTKHYQELPLQITFTGHYRDILLYLAWLEQLKEWANYSEVTAFELTLTDGLGPANQFDLTECNLTLTMYSTTPK